jgi:hypothetical protein
MLDSDMGDRTIDSDIGAGDLIPDLDRLCPCRLVSFGVRDEAPVVEGEAARLPGDRGVASPAFFRFMEGDRFLPFVLRLVALVGVRRDADANEMSMFSGPPSS